METTVKIKWDKPKEQAWLCDLNIQQALRAHCKNTKFEVTDLSLFDINNISVNYLVDVLKRTLKGNDEVRVEFNNKEDNINYILDVCNNFKKELEKDIANKTTNN